MRLDENHVTVRIDPSAHEADQSQHRSRFDRTDCRQIVGPEVLEPQNHGPTAERSQPDRRNGLEHWGRCIHEHDVVSLSGEERAEHCRRRDE